MATADLITQLKRDFDDVYAAGKAAGGGSGDYDQGYEDGKNSVVNLGKYAKAIRFNSLNDFNSNDLIIKLENAVDLSKFLYIENEEDINNTVEILTINCDKPVLNMNRFYYHLKAAYKDNTLKKITFNIDTSKCVDSSFMLHNLSALEVIDGQPLDFTNANSMNYPFYNATALKEVRFAANSIYKNFNINQSNKLSFETIQSIVDGLADLSGELKFYEVGNQIGPSDFEYPAVEKELTNVHSYQDAYMFMTDGAPVYSVTYGDFMINTYAYAKGGIAQSLTLHADVMAKITDEQKAAIAAKNWILG